MNNGLFIQKIIQDLYFFSKIFYYHIVKFRMKHEENYGGALQNESKKKTRRTKKQIEKELRQRVLEMLNESLKKELLMVILNGEALKY